MVKLLDPVCYPREGAVADVLVFDRDQFIDQATFEQPARYTAGVRYLFIAGNLALQGTAPSRQLRGRLIRHGS